MKILTITAYYPPYSYGGYENRVRDVMDELSARGHQVSALTTQPDKKKQVAPMTFSYPVNRRLHSTRKELGWAERLTQKKSTNRIGVALVFLRQIYFDLCDLRLIDKTIKSFQPDVIYLGHILPLSANILPYLAASSTKIVQDDGGKTLEWCYEMPGLWVRFLTEIQPDSVLIDKFKIAFISLVSAFSNGRVKKTWTWPEKINVFFNNHVCYQSFLSKQIPYNQAVVINSGLDTEQFPYKPVENSNGTLGIIVPGRVEPKKGQLDAVNLSAELTRNNVDHSLTIVGDPWNKEYVKLIQKAITDLELGKWVKILPAHCKAELVDLYHQSEICFFPSYQHIGFSRVPLEAMACGCLVISYGNEGSDEIIRNEENGFVVEPGNLTQTSMLIQRLSANWAETEKITRTARQELEQKYSISKYIDQIESFLKWILNQN